MNNKLVTIGIMVSSGVFFGTLGFVIVESLSKEYQKNHAVETIKRPPSNQINYNPKERFCQQQSGWHPDCNVE
jgi:hypothetical protein